MNARGGRPARLLLAATVALALAVAPAGCAGGEDPDEAANAGRTRVIKRDPRNAGVTVRVGSRGSTEQRVLGQIYAQALEAAGYTATANATLGSEQVAFDALRRGDVDGYPGYVSALLTSFFDLRTAEVPSDAGQALQESRERFAREGLVAFEPTPFANVNAVAMLKTRAEALDVRTLSGLQGESQDLVLYGPPDCRASADCLAGLQQGYQLTFKGFLSGDVASRYDVLEERRADLSIISATDAELVHRSGIVTLDDDRQVLPAGNVTFVARGETVRSAGPDLRETIELVQGDLTVQVVRELNARVELDRVAPAQVAGEYLREAGYVKAG
jgi:glycine betaine/choline ABC-type transport system substrate-binding protein